MYEAVDPDNQDCSEELDKLTLIAFDNEKHFAKYPTDPLLVGVPGFPHVVQLLGRTEEGTLVFPKSKQSFGDHGRIKNIRRWMLDIIDGVAYLHLLGTVHRDLTMWNVLDSDPLVICDLQCYHASGHCRPFEIDGGDYSKFSFASDIFALGPLL